MRHGYCTHGPAHAAAIPDPVSGAPPRVLIVEDHELTRRFLADNLAAPTGMTPLATGSVADARQLIATESPAVAVLDLALPDGDGLALLTELRRPESELDRGCRC